mmetsp:Transcript_8629/g.35956  ORF Transcript_8629/g.35956 Transcript_8629/m.35956 type:complete len:555 (+) Transcript_8629:141-1805(+)
MSATPAGEEALLLYESLLADAEQLKKTDVVAAMAAQQQALALLQAAAAAAPAEKALMYEQEQQWLLRRHAETAAGMAERLDASVAQFCKRPEGAVLVDVGGGEQRPLQLQLPPPSPTDGMLPTPAIQGPKLPIRSHEMRKQKLREEAEEQRRNGVQGRALNGRPLAPPQEESDSEEEDDGSFKTAYQKLKEKDRERMRRTGGGSGAGGRTLGKRSKYSPADNIRDAAKGKGKKRKRDEEEEKERHPIFEDERMEHIEERMAELILSEILDTSVKTTWSDIAGLEFAKKNVQEMVIYPMLRPDLFTGIRQPAKGLLLFGPPGTGKTMIGKAIAGEAGATFFNISASSLTSKYVGEGEKMVRALFTVARCYPSSIKVIFIDEIDSLLTQRSESDQEASRRIKTEFLVQMDGAGCDPKERILVIGATNRPQEIDEAARRRFVKRLYIPLPAREARQWLVENLLAGQRHSLSEKDARELAELTEGYSGSDLHGLCQEAALGPIRSVTNILQCAADDVRPIEREDFTQALTRVRSSVGKEELRQYEDWNKLFGSFHAPA